MWTLKVFQSFPIFLIQFFIKLGFCFCYSKHKRVIPLTLPCKREGVIYKFSITLLNIIHLLRLALCIVKLRFQTPFLSYDAFAVAIYIRWALTDDSIHVLLLCAKPLKRICTPCSGLNYFGLKLALSSENSPANAGIVIGHFGLLGIQNASLLVQRRLIVHMVAHKFHSIIHTGFGFS